MKDSPIKLGLLGIQHVFAMFGATVLVPILTGIDVSVALLCAGGCTWLFHLITGRKVPAFLGSSFAFIGAIIAVATMKSGLTPDEITALGDGLMASAQYQEGLRYATGGVVAAGLVYFILAALVFFFGVDRVRSFFPPVVTGPMVLIIGLMLAPTAISSISAPLAGVPTSINWLIAAITILTIILVTLFAKGFYKLVPILIGIVVGYLVSICFGIVDFEPIVQASWLSIPAIKTPLFSWEAIMIIAPIAIVTFVEHIGDMTANGAVVGKDFFKDPGLHKTLIGDGVATMVAGFLGGPANTTYSENTGVLAATKNYNPVTLEIAATFAILMSIFGKLGAVLQTLPGPVMGGVSVILFGMIASVGLRTLVENNVDFKQSRNLLIVAVMLVMGLGANGALSIGSVSVSGVALAAILGIILNKILPSKMDADSRR